MTLLYVKAASCLSDFPFLLLFLSYFFCTLFLHSVLDTPTHTIVLALLIASEVRIWTGKSLTICRMYFLFIKARGTIPLLGFMVPSLQRDDNTQEQALYSV